MLRLILCGNPNSGKSTLFNRLCGAYRHTGNFPGVSVDRGEGVFVRDGICYTVVDLPGMYALTAGSAEEQIAAEALLGIDGVLVQVIDTAAPERALRLTATLAALRRPLVLAMNMADEAERRGVTVDLPAFTQMTGIPAVSISARRGEGLEDLLAAARHAPLTAGDCDTAAYGVAGRPLGRRAFAPVCGFAACGILDRRNAVFGIRTGRHGIAGGAERPA